MARKRRSTLWVVSTHLLTTGLAMPALAAWAAYALIAAADVRNPLAALSIQAACAMVGYIGGTLYSLAFLRASAEHDRWTDCTKPSIVGFTILALLGFAWNVMQLRERNAVSIGILAVCYVFVLGTFSWLTASACVRMSQVRKDIPETQPPQRHAEPALVRDPRPARLLGGCIGFAVAFALGLGFAIANDGAGLEPPLGWQTRLITAVACGGVGCLLGLISGPPRL